MSFMNELLKKKKELKSCVTIVTSPTGSRYVEKKNDSGEVEKEEVDRCHGYVVDDALDLQIAHVLKFLCLSSQDPAQDGELLEKNEITHVLSIGVDLPTSGRLPKISYKKVNLFDEPSASLSEVLDECFEFIEGARRESERNCVLVHCNAGYSRAPAIVVGYLMKRYGHSLAEALEMVKEKRNVKPNEGFMKQLKELEKTVSKATV